MLMDFMRRNTKRFLIVTIALVVPAFILWGAFPSLGTRETRTVMEVAGEKISLQEFAQYYQGLRETARRSLGANYSPEIERMLNLKQQAVDRMVREILLGTEVERLDIVVSDEEVQASLKQNPSFYTDGAFDAAKWNAWISNPQVNWTALIEQERERLRMQKLVDLISSQARVTEPEIQDEFRRRNEKVRLEYVAYEAADYVDDIEITPEELASYYEEHKREYMEPAQVKLEYVELKKEPSQMDYEDVKIFAQDVLEKARRGADFAELARTYSDDPGSASKGGDLGFFGKGRMVDEFEEAAFSMKPGEISDLVKSQFGYHIIKVEEVRGEGEKKEVHARHILLKVEPTEDTLLSLEEQAARLASGAARSSLEQAASELGLTTSSTPMFAETSPVIPNVGPVREIIEILPGMQEGMVSDVIETNQAFYVFRVAERKPERIPELSEVETQVRSALRTAKALDVAKAKAEELVAKANGSGLAFDKLEGAPEPKQVEPFTRRGRPAELPYLEGMVESAFELEPGKAAGPFASLNSVYVIRLQEKIAADPAEYETQKESIRDRLLMQRQEQVFQDYIENLKQKYEVKIDEELMRAV
ncbi:MAG: peptidylprolyl isomerase [Candidatus Abyssubacteria bacterium]